jgi:hypothetical protein
MKYLCLLYYDTDAFARMSAQEAAALESACAPHDALLEATGQVRVTGTLAMPDTWMHLVPRDGNPELRSGPYLAVPQQVGAFLIVEAESDHEAHRVASRHAAANVGEPLGFAVDVRRCDGYRES